MPTPQDSLPETMPAAEFKAKCPAIITKFGHQVAKLVPCASDSEAEWDELLPRVSFHVP